MSSSVKLPSNVISAVAFGAGVVAIGWLGWKAYAKLSARIVQVSGCDPVQGQIVSIDAALPEDCPAVDEVNNVPLEDDEKVADVPEAAVGDLEEEPSCAPSFDAVQYPCAADSGVDSIVVIVNEDTSPSVDQVCDSIKEGPLPEPTADEVCAEHPVSSTRHELVEDVLVPAGGQLVDGDASAVPDAPARAYRVRKPHKALWNASYQRRLARRAKEREERAAMEQQAFSNVCSTSEPVVTATDEDAAARANPESVPIQSADVPACEEHTPASSQQKLPVAPVQDRSGDLAAMSLEELSAVAVEDVSYWPNKTCWNVSFQRRYLVRLKLSLKGQSW